MFIALLSIDWLVAVINFILAFIIIFKKPTNKQNVFFSLACFFSGLWSIGLFFFNYPYGFNAQTWLQIVYVIADIIELFIILFTYYFSVEQKLSLKPVLLGFFVLAAIGLYILFGTDYMILNISTDPEWGSKVSMGWGYIVYSLTPVYAFLYIIFLLIKKNKIAVGRERLQLRFYTLGIIIMGIGLMFADVLLPIFFNESALFGISPIFYTIFFIAIFYAIANFRFLNIESIIGTIINNVLAGLFAVCLFFGLNYIYTILFGGVLTINAFVTGIITTPIALFFFTKLNNLVTKVTDKYIIHRKLDPNKSLNDFIKKISTELDIDRLAKHLIVTLTRDLDTVGMGLVLFDLENTKIMYRRSSSGINIDWDRDLLQIVHYWNDIGNDPIMLYDEMVRMPEPESATTKDRFKKVLNFMKSNKIHAILPLNRKVSMNGIVLLGKKENNEAFTVEETDFMDNIIANASVAMSRALLFNQVKSFNTKLKQEIKNATEELQYKNVILEKEERKLNAAYKELKTLDEAKSDFISIASHQLRTPLSVIKGYLSMLGEDDYGTITKEQKGIVTQSINALNDLNGIINDILTSSRIEKGSLTITKDDADIIELLNYIFKLYKNKYQTKGLEFKITLPPKIKKLIVSIDREKFEQVIINLIENAFNYTPAGSVILTLNDKKSSFLISISDTGIGIPEEGKTKLFERFIRLANAQKLRPDGTGIGLYTAKIIVEKHGGKIWYKSEEGKGATFFVEIPKK